MAETTLEIKIDAGKGLVDLKQLSSRLKDVEKQGDRADKSVDKLSRGFQAASKMAAAFTAAIAGVGFVKVIAQYEELEGALGVVFKSTERGTKVFQELQALSEKTPFAINQLTESVIKLRAAGIEPTTNQLMLFSDVASVTTDKVGTLQAITDLFARTTAGGLGLEDLNRLADRGIPVFDILSKRLGVSRLEVAKLGQTSEGAKQILEALTQELNVRFGGASEKAANQLSVQLSNLGIAFNNFLNAIGQTGILNSFKSAVNGITNAIVWMKSNVDVLGDTVLILALTQIPKLITSIKILAAAAMANPFGLLLTAMSALLAGALVFRKEFNEIFIKLFEVIIPNAIDRFNIALKRGDRFIKDFLNKILGDISDFTNTLRDKAPDFIKNAFGIDKSVKVDFTFDTASINRQIVQLEQNINDRIVNFNPELIGKGVGLSGGISDLIGIDMDKLKYESDNIRGEIDKIDKSVKGLQDGSLTGNRAEKESIDQQIGKLRKELQLTSDPMIKINEQIAKLNELRSLGNISGSEYNEKINELLGTTTELAKAQKEYEQTVLRLNTAFELGAKSSADYLEQMNQAENKLKEALSKTDESIQIMGVGLDSLKQIALDATDTMADAFLDFALGSKSSFKDAAMDILKQIAKIIIRAQLMRAMFGESGQGGIIGGFFGGAAKGAAFNNGVTAFANGGVINRPTAFGLSGGKMGIAGESGPEAIAPLRRDSGGNLGVSAVAPVVNVNVQNNASNADIDIKQSQTGDLIISVMDIVKNGLSSGQLDGAMAGAYGIKRRAF